MLIKIKYIEGLILALQNKAETSNTANTTLSNVNKPSSRSNLNVYSKQEVDSLVNGGSTDFRMFEDILEFVQSYGWATGNRAYVKDDNDGKFAIYISEGTLGSPDMTYLQASFRKIVDEDSLNATPTVFTSDIPVVLSNGKTLGKYSNGQTISSIGKTFEQVMKDIALEYVQPVFTSFTVSSHANIVEIGTTISGIKTFSWGVLQNSGNVSTFDIVDNTANSNLGTNISGSSTNISVTSNLLSSDGQTQSWRMRGYDITSGIIYSQNVVATARFKRWWGATDSDPTNRSSAIALPSTDFQNQGVNIFTLVTGTTKLKMVVLLPAGKTITSVYDSTNNATVTSSYIQSTININDAGGTPRLYNKYTLTLGGTYPTSANHVITTN